MTVLDIYRSLKALAEELDCTILATSQLGRELEEREDKRPVFNDVRELKAVEKYIDIIAFLYRDELYNEDSYHKNMAEIIISKQRNGPIGKVFLSFQGEYRRFINYENEAIERKL